jgi:hypothetical protein
MERSTRIVATLFVASSCMLGCDLMSGYTGDGRLRDHGLLAATDRYVLELGPLPLDKQLDASYDLVNLPSEEFVLGLQIAANTRSGIEAIRRSMDAVISVVLTDSRARTVFFQESNLRDWTWSIPSGVEEAFVYRKGSSGTYFTPEAHARYKLTIKVIVPDASGMSYSSALLAKSGGWK